VHLEMFEEIKNLLVEEMAIDEAEIREDAEFINDLGFNSLEVADLVSLCEEKYDVDLEEDKMREIVTVGDFVKYLESIK
ncbi:MAG: acyl carrier protein, partial [Clostridia bacterium]|nr:acyl carrier protein [Clostridia bacterium]